MEYKYLWEVKFPSEYSIHQIDKFKNIIYQGSLNSQTGLQNPPEKRIRNNFYEGITSLLLIYSREVLGWLGDP